MRSEHGTVDGIVFASNPKSAENDPSHPDYVTLKYEDTGEELYLTPEEFKEKNGFKFKIDQRHLG